MNVRQIPLALTALLGLRADSVSLTSAADTGMMSANPGNNYGRLVTVPVGTSARGGQIARGLFRFDVAGVLPPGSVVTRATLRFRVFKEASGGGQDTVGLHRMLVDWVEGTKASGSHGAAASTGESTWTARRLGTDDWAAPGGLSGTDFAANSSAEVTWNEPGTYTLNSTTALVADVQSWLENPQGNHGWMLRSRQEGVAASAKRVCTREAPTGEQPILTLEFTPPAPFEPTLQPPRLVEGSVELRYLLEPGHTYELRASESLGAGPTVLTNHTVKFTGFEALFADPILSGRRLYQLVITGDVD